MKRTHVALGVLLAVGLAASAHAGPILDLVVSFNPGARSGVFDFGDPISAYAGPSGAGTFDPGAVGAIDRVSLALGGAFGAPGSIVLSSSSGVSIVDGPGADLLLYDSFGLSEGVSVDVSTDGISFFSAGVFDGSTAATTPLGLGTTFVTSVDISSSGLSSASFVRLTAAPLSVLGFPEAYDLDAAEAVNFSRIPEPSTLALLGLALAGLGWRKQS